MLSRLPEDVRAGFTPQQLAALDGALDANNARRHPINVRVTLFGMAYLVVLAGRENRTRRRRVEERKRHPLATPGNLVFLTVVAILGLILGSTLRSLISGG